MLDNKISEFIQHAEMLGEQGKLEESEAVSRQIDRLKDDKAKMLTKSEHPLTIKEKQMRVGF